MGILSFFSKPRVSLPHIVHPVFGPMEATLVNDDGSYFWETPDAMATPKGPVSVFLDGAADGPSEAQVELWRWIYDNSEHLAKTAEPLLLDRLSDFNLGDRLADLVWGGVGLSVDGSRDGAWDMSFDLSARSHRMDGAIFTAYFESCAPVRVTVDS